MTHIRSAPIQKTGNGRTRSWLLTLSPPKSRSSHVSHVLRGYATSRQSERRIHTRTGNGPKYLTVFSSPASLRSIKWLGGQYALADVSPSSSPQQALGLMSAGDPFPPFALGHGGFPTLRSSSSSPPGDVRHDVDFVCFGVYTIFESAVLICSCFLISWYWSYKSTHSCFLIDYIELSTFLFLDFVIFISMGLYRVLECWFFLLLTMMGFLCQAYGYVELR